MNKSKIDDQYFHHSAAEDDLKDKEEDTTENEKIKKEEEQNADNSKATHETPESVPKGNETDKVENKTKTSPKNVNGTSKGAVEKKPKIMLIKEPISSEVDYSGVPHLEGEPFLSSVAK